MGSATNLNCRWSCCFFDPEPTPSRARGRRSIWPSLGTEFGHRRLASRDRSGAVPQTFRDNAINADVLCKAIGEPPEDPLLLFLLLTGYVVANGVAGNVEACRDVATSIFSLAEKQQASAPLVLGHISWVILYYLEEKSRTERRISIRRSPFTILRSTACCILA